MRANPTNEPMPSLPDSNAAAFVAAGSREMSGRLMLFFAFAVGVVVLGLDASQPLTGLIGASFRMDASEASLVTTFTLLGDATGRSLAGLSQPSPLARLACSTSRQRQSP